MKRMVDNKKLSEIEASAGDNFLVVDMNFSRTSGNYIYADCVIDDEVKEKISNGEIKIISGTFRYKNGQLGHFAVNFYKIEKHGPESVSSYAGVNYFNGGTTKLELESIDYTSGNEKLELAVQQYALS